MLNELTLIRNGLQAVNEQALKVVHKNINEPGKTNIMRVILNEEGKITELDLLDGERNKNYWSHGNSNKNKFPDIKLRFPLRSGGVEEFHKWSRDNNRPSEEELIACIEALRDKYPFEITDKTWPDYWCKLEERSEIYASLQGASSIVYSLIKVFLETSDKGRSLLKQFDHRLWGKAKQNPEFTLLKFASLVMFGGGQELKYGKLPDGKRPTLLLDLIIDHTSHSAANKHWKPDISKVLFKSEQHLNETISGKCVISGRQDVKLVSDTFPTAKCESLGNVKIFSRKKGVQTYRRYGKLATDSISVSADLADELKSALEYLNNKEKGTTWDLLPSEAGGNDLLLAFCRDYPNVNAARLVAYKDEQDNSLDESGYEIEASAICQSFKGNDIGLSVEPRIDFLILRKISDGVQKAVFSSSIPVPQLETQAANWNNACKNVPSTELALFMSGKICSPNPISPKQFGLIFRKNYSRSSFDKKIKKQKNVPGISFSEVMTLFLNDVYTSDTVRRLLSKILKQFSSLLEIVALEKTHKKIPSGKTLNKHHRQDALYAITAVGLFLYKLGRKKEVYMKELAYKLGQFCSVLDEIHIGYCESERKGKEPGRLIGNQAYAAAVMNPRKALEITAQRFAVYKSWAYKNCRKEDGCLGENAKNAKYASFWLRKNSGELHKLIPEKIPVSTPESKAELLLGYLAGRDIVKTQNSITSKS